MKKLILSSAAAIALGSGALFAQTAEQGVRVAPGHFCADNKCMRFSDDLRSVSIQARVPVSVTQYELSANPVITREIYREIFMLALRQDGVGVDR
ncbi:hypothetical protein [Sulfitobacter guttiformis]|uniref:Uncharacterized protein n=1 Tax=Sulfitobacter guttiformis TaxID=74349 RepID=A0A420DI66_9RHOB|nr:hypothetical protein [Sulfitobacter guttiformis]KIN72345.1 hypothetical protein Z949_1518 [Sulfitobacter guttiformis KCTC 32187]RKE93897.1 hypothetical protein C8N30_2999 [Sulfitobacter guttiformis]